MTCMDGTAETEGGPRSGIRCCCSVQAISCWLSSARPSLAMQLDDIMGFAMRAAQPLEGGRDVWKGGTSGTTHSRSSLLAVYVPRPTHAGRQGRRRRDLAFGAGARA